MSAGLVRVDYAGPGGTCEGMRMLGLEPVGIEWDAAACATRAAAGHLTIRADLATYRPRHEPGSVWGYWASPPCQTFSTAGGGTGRDQLDNLGTTILAESWADAHLFDDKTRHVIDAARTATTLGADWIGLEQVPAVLPLWRALAYVLGRYGYSTWAGVLCAADWGVPQTRERAVLIASRSRCANPPEPTHAEQRGMFGEQPWVTMAEALGWTEYGTSWPYTSPATTVAGDPRITARCHHDAGTQGSDARTTEQVRRGEYDGTQPIRLTVDERVRLQTFPACYPFAGNQGEQAIQIGNAVPPLLAAHVVSAASGLRLPELVGTVS